MALEEYRRKRDFARTPEPSGAAPAAEGAHATHPVLFPGWERLPRGRRFCVQMHHASRLHWDLRLELDGVLLSWAVPKGPTLDPAEKRLAVHVEDHPLDYGDFEGVIPDGYGAGTVMLWDAGTLEWIKESAPDPRAGLDGGDLKFSLDGVKLRGEFALVRTGGRRRPAAEAGAAAARQWLLIKKRDAAVVPGFDAADLDISVLSGRSLAEIAAGAPVKAGDAAASARWRAGDGLDPATLLETAPRRHVPATVAPMLATPVTDPFSRAGWLFEMKYDGVRALATVADGKVRLRSRHGRDETRRYPELQALSGALSVADAVVDGEVVALDPEGRPAFELLQQRLNLGDLRQVEQARAAVPAVYMAFDLLGAAGHDLRDLPLRERKRILRSLLTDGDVVRYADHVEAEGKPLFEAVTARGVEGVVAKDGSSRYEAGRRSPAWLKLRAWRTQDCAIGGFTAGRAGRGALGALVLGVMDGPDLVPCGRVGSGLGEAALRDLATRLEGLRVDDCPFITVPVTDTRPTWVRPELVCSVRHMGWTRAGTLRQPVFRGLRPDLTLADCVREREVSSDAVLPATPPATVRAQVAAGGGRNLPQPVDLGLTAHEPALEELRRMPADGFWELAGRRLRLTNLDKPLWPADGIRKRDLIAYYVTMAPLLLTHLRDRAVGMQVFPDGIDGKHFWRKRIPDHAPDWIRTWTYHGDRTVTYVLVDEVATLAWMANAAVIDIHPWHSRVDAPNQPDWAVFDLDPFPPATFDDVRHIGRLVKTALDHYGLRGLPKVSGQTGLQIYVPLQRGPDQDQVRAWVEEVARAIGRVAPDLVTFEWSVARRTGRLRIDYTQNVVGKTLAAPYSVRPAPRAPVSTPVTWEELEGDSIRPDSWTMGTVIDRVAQVGDLFAAVLEGGQALPPSG